MDTCINIGKEEAKYSNIYMIQISTDENLTKSANKCFIK